MNNILKIEKFIKDNSNPKIIINKVNDEIDIFYQTVITYFSKINKTSLVFNSKKDVGDSSNDLFGGKKIYVSNTVNTKDIAKILNHNRQEIIISDYRNYKKLKNDYESINGYEFEKDLKFFIEKTLGISNQELIVYCKAYPHFTYSETSKYLTNNKYKKDINHREITNFILQIRKDIFNLKNDDDIKNIYLKIKSESKYKKFSFLTY